MGLVAIVGGILYIKQDQLLYFPSIAGLPRHNQDNPRGYRSPADQKVAFEEARIPCTDGVRIHAWLLWAMQGQDASQAPTILFFHGNAGNIGLRLPNAINMLLHLGVNVLLVEYRGYGDSDDVPPTEAGLKLDAQAALEWIQRHRKVDSSKIFVFGRSLGGAVAIRTQDLSCTRD